jgi:hypothetical protein
MLHLDAQRGRTGNPSLVSCSRRLRIPLSACEWKIIQQPRATDPARQRKTVGAMGTSMEPPAMAGARAIGSVFRSHADRQTDFALQLLFPSQVCRWSFPVSPAGACQQREFLRNDGDGRYQHHLSFRQFGSRVRHNLRNYPGGKSDYAPPLLHRERLHRWTISLGRTGAGRQWTPLRHKSAGGDLTCERGNGCGSVFSLSVGPGPLVESQPTY